MPSPGPSLLYGERSSAAAPQSDQWLLRTAERLQPQWDPDLHQGQCPNRGANNPLSKQQLREEYLPVLDGPMTWHPDVPFGHNSYRLQIGVWRPGRFVVCKLVRIRDTKSWYMHTSEDKIFPSLDDALSCAAEAPICAGLWSGELTGDLQWSAITRADFQHRLLELDTTRS